MRVDPKSKADAERLWSLLTKLADEDACFRASRDPDSGQIVLGGMSEQHLDSKIETLAKAYDIETNIGVPQVAYRETILRGADIDYTHMKRLNGLGGFARVRIAAEPGEPGSGFLFRSKIAGDSALETYIPGVEKGLTAVIRSGILAGFPVIDVTVELVDGAYHALDSSTHVFEIASRAAMREALQRGQSVLLEPVMTVEVTMPEDHTDAVISDLNSRRGRIDGEDKRAGQVVISATVPLASMVGYPDTLSSITQGRATFSMEFDRYARLPAPSDDRPPSAPAVALRA